MLESKKVFIFGYSGHSYVVIESLINAGYTIIGYFDHQEALVNPYKIPYFGYEESTNLKELIEGNLVFPTVGENGVRQKLITLFEKFELNQFVAVDPKANISNSTLIGPSTYIGKNACVNAQSKIGKGVIINTNAIVEHDCIIDNFVHLGPSSVLCGNVRIGERTLIGAGSTIKQNIEISSNVLLGAGSVVVKPILKQGVYFGNPAKLK